MSVSMVLQSPFPIKKNPNNSNNKKTKTTTTPTWRRGIGRLQTVSKQRGYLYPTQTVNTFSRRRDVDPAGSFPPWGKAWIWHHPWWDRGDLARQGSGLCPGWGWPRASALPRWWLRKADSPQPRGVSPPFSTAAPLPPSTSASVTLPLATQR